MIDILLLPGAPYFCVALAGALTAALGIGLSERRRLAFSGTGLASLSIGRRMLVGQLAGAIAAALLLLTIFAAGLRDGPRSLLIVAALAAYLGLGVVLPRRPLIRRQREAATLRRLTPGFIAFVRVALGSFEAPIEIMRRYIARPYPPTALMQSLVTTALQIGQDQRLRPFAALSIAARNYGCRELIDVAEALAQAEAEGGRIDSVLTAQQETLELILQSEFKRMLRRRTLYLLLLVAVSLVVGILLNLLFVMTGGGAIFARFG